jgi:hypothetical protein
MGKDLRFVPAFLSGGIFGYNGRRTVTCAGYVEFYFSLLLAS